MDNKKQNFLLASSQVSAPRLIQTRRQPQNLYLAHTQGHRQKLTQYYNIGIGTQT